MRARNFNKQVLFYETSEADDGFGGQTTTTSLLFTTWAKVETIKGSHTIKNLGLNYTNLNLKITIRNRDDIQSRTLFCKYRDEDYAITSYPINDNFGDSFISFIATKQ